MIVGAITRNLTSLCLLLMACTSWAQSHTSDNPYPPTLEELAASSDLIGIAQVYYTDYEYSHSYPVAGTAYLKMLITYRAEEPVELFRVKEKGLHSGECYFPSTEYGKDGPRFLVFLSQGPDGDYIGNPRLCMVPVAVTVDQAYALPYPRPELNLTDAGEAAVMDIEFSDTNATVDASEMTRSMAARKAEELGGEVRGQRIVFTRGIPISEVRSLMGKDKLILPRSTR